MRRKGRVKFFNREKGYGFIAPEDGGKDIFVHTTAVHSAGVPYLKENMVISFEAQEDARGRGQQAVALQILSVE